MNKKQLVEAINASSPYMEHVFHEKYGVTVDEVRVKAAQAYLSIMDDVEALKEARGKATGGEWCWWDSYDFGKGENNSDFNSENFKEGRIKLCSGGQRGEVILKEWAEYASDSGLNISDEDAQFITVAANTIAKWGKS